MKISFASKKITKAFGIQPNVTGRLSQKLIWRIGTQILEVYPNGNSDDVAVIASHDANDHSDPMIDYSADTFHDSVKQAIDWVKRQNQKG